MATIWGSICPANEREGYPESVHIGQGGDAIYATQVPIGTSAIVIELRLESQERRRLMDLGFVPGVKIEKVLDAPLGGTIAFRIRGTVIALRDTQTDRIEVALCKD